LTIGLFYDRSVLVGRTIVVLFIGRGFVPDRRRKRWLVGIDEPVGLIIHQRQEDFPHTFLRMERNRGRLDELLLLKGVLVL
jgi:hypothetical protein